MSETPKGTQTPAGPGGPGRGPGRGGGFGPGMHMGMAPAVKSKDLKGR